jgi:putative ABC transport system substrate-binding protein
MTTRRNALLALPLACTAAASLAQAPKAGPVKRVGILLDGTESPVPPAERPLYVALKQKGWNLGENLLREPAYTGGETERLPALAEELVRKRVDLILAIGDTPAVMAARATRTIPIVFSAVLFPVELGLVDSLVQPGRNVTGQSLIAGTGIAAKRMAMLKQIAPDAKRLAYLVPAVVPAFLTVSGGRFDVTAAFEAAAKNLGLESRIQPLPSPQHLDAAFGEMLAWRAQAVTAGVGYHQAVPKQVAQLLLRHRLPSAFLTREMVDAGGLLSYGVGRTEAGYADTRLADYIDRVLRGTPPAALPVEQPRRYELVINLRTAKALGLTVPQSLLIQADELVE